jgi:trehalose 6-phosphate synthase
MWIGWPGGGVEMAMPAQHAGIELRSVPPDDAEFEQFSLGFSNTTLWPLHHDAVRAPTFHREWWYAYVSVNDRYARAGPARR